MAAISHGPPALDLALSFEESGSPAGARGSSLTLGKEGMAKIAYVDVDDTLVRSAGTKRIPILSTVRHVKSLKHDGWQLYCWSSGGGDYARQSAVELGIADCFVGFLPKPELMIDDVPPQE